MGYEYSSYLAFPEDPPALSVFAGDIPVLSVQGHKAMIDFRQDTWLSIQ